MTAIAYPYGVDGTLLRVLEAGDGPETMILLHGLGARAERWERNLEPLAAAGYRVLAVDLPGHGFAEKGAHLEHGVPAYARLTRRLIEQVSPGRPVTLVGTSLGGHVAATVAADEPEAIRALVLVGPVGLTTLGEQARAAIAATVVDTSLEGIRAKLARVLYDDDAVTERWVTEEQRINTSPGADESLDAIARYFAERVDDDVLDERRLRSVLDAVPTLLLWGTEDEIVPLAVAEQLERALGVEVTRIPAAGHAPYFESPDAFHEAVLGFLASR